MEKFDSISHFLQSGGFEYRVYDMGRKVWQISNKDFENIENQGLAFPYPFQQKASIALLFWPKGKEAEATIWFLQFPIDELGFLQQAARDTFLIDLLEQTGKNIQAKQKGNDTEDGLKESPFAFKPREDRLAMFHAIATTVLKQEPSQHYQYAHDYLLPKENGGPGFEQWQFLGIQGLSDLVTRLAEDDNDALLATALQEMPEVPLTSYAQALENIVISEELFIALENRIRAEMSKDKLNPVIVASLIRGVSAFSNQSQRLALLHDVLKSNLFEEVEVVAAISARSWNDLLDDEFRQVFLQSLASHQQMAFNAIISDLIQIPGMRDLVLGALRSENRSAELTQKFGAFMQGVTQ